MRQWYDVIYNGRVQEYGVTKEVRAAISSDCTWTAEKLQKAMRDIRQPEPMVVGLEITHFERINEPSKNDERFSKRIDIDQALGI